MTDIQEIVEVECPYCAEKVNSRAKKCKHCGEILDSTMRELEFLKSNKKDIYVTNNAASSASSSTSTPIIPTVIIHNGSSMASWALGTGITFFFICLLLSADETLTKDDAIGASILAAVPIILGTIVLNTDRPGKNKARWAIVLAVLSVISIFNSVD